jgi:hypothetical protein
LFVFFCTIINSHEQLAKWVDLSFEHTDTLTSILSRIFLTTVAVSAAGFCASRYVRWKNLEEDYQYKTVLSRSIVAFANKIKDVDNTKVAEYLNMVLSELHQNPLRNHKSSEANKEGV